MNFILIVPLLIGWISGWIVNYLVDVLPATRFLSQPACPSCQTKYKWSDYLLFRNCSNCGKRRGIRTLIVQVILTVGPLVIWIYPNHTLPFPLAVFLLVYLCVVFVIDLEHRLILHPVSIFGAVLGLGIGIFLRSKLSVTYGITSTLLGGSAAFGVMLVFYFVGELFVKYNSKKHGMSPDEVALGFGDVNLAGILGLMVGWKAVFLFLFIAIMVGGVVGLLIKVGMVIMKRNQAFIAIPYAPFLIASAFYFLFI
jgi:leader peptidase (prepilin peptidase)/N-methyltransferase